MNTKLTCPVCGHTDIEGNRCPNCDTNLSLIRSLTELSPSSPQTETSQPDYIPKRSRIAAWQLGAAGIILLIGIGLGAVGNSLLMQPQLLTNIIPRPSPIAVSGKSGSLPLANQPMTPADISTSASENGNPSSFPSIEQETTQSPTEYTIQRGDSLSKIAERLCGKGTSWQRMVEANPQLQGREDAIDVGEVLKVPRCKEG